MTDDLLAKYARIDAGLSRLVAAALEDLAGAAMPSGDPTAPITTGGGRSDPTGQSVNVDPTGNLTTRLDQARDYQTITRGIDHILGLVNQIETTIDRLENRLTHVNTGTPCPTRATDPDTGNRVDCNGTITHNGFCESCDDWHRRPQNRGHHMPYDVLKARNERRPRWCDCTCCLDEDGKSSHCTDRAAEGRTVSDRCRKRAERARQHDRALSTRL